MPIAASSDCAVSRLRIVSRRILPPVLPHECYPDADWRGEQVDSTRRAVEMGNQKWRRLLDSHDQLARQTVEGHRGNLIKNTADGILATLRWTRSRRTLCAGIFGRSQTDWPAPAFASAYWRNRGQGPRYRLQACGSRRPEPQPPAAIVPRNTGRSLWSSLMIL
jgi:hypothetical protein